MEFARRGPQKPPDPMTHWKLTLAYHGQGFHGWQIQPGLATVQGALGAALERLTGDPVLPQGAGRTDAGVHALRQVASFCLEAPIPAQSLRRALNRTLPPSIRVIEAEMVAPDFHARHSARGKRYEYRIFERRLRRESPNAAAAAVEERVCSPFLAPLVWDCRWPLDLAAMEAAAGLLLGTHDFSAMAASARPPRAAKLAEPQPLADASEPNPVKTIHSAGWGRAGDLLHFHIQGSGFLHHMVRNLVGTLVDIGRGSLAAEDLPRILASRDRAQAGPTAPAQGLYLAQVFYPAASDPRPGAER